MIAWALIGGTFVAFTQPARDALLTRVAGGDIQRVVTRAVGVQFGVQIIGFAIGSTALLFGAAPVLMVQGTLMGVAVLATMRIPGLPPAPPRPRASALREIADGPAIVWRSEVILPAVLVLVLVPVAGMSCAALLLLSGSLLWHVRRGSIALAGP